MGTNLAGQKTGGPSHPTQERQGTERQCKKMFGLGRKKSSEADGDGDGSVVDASGRSSSSSTSNSRNNPNKKKSSGFLGRRSKASGSSSSAAASTPSAAAKPREAAPKSNSGSDSNISSGMITFRVPVPRNVTPGEEFQVFAGGRIIRVRCPLDSRPGQSLQITVPREQVPADNGERESNSNIADGNNTERGSNGNDSSSRRLHHTNHLPAPPDSDNVTKIANQELRPGEMPAYMVRIPECVVVGQSFSVTIGGQVLNVKCPDMARPGMSVKITPPTPPPQSLHNDDDVIEGGGGRDVGDRNNHTTRQHQQQQRHQHRNNNNNRPHRIANPNRSSDKTQMFEVIVPPGVNPGRPFALLAGGVRVLVTCPRDARAGQKIRFNLPIGLLNRPDGPKSKLAEIKLSYDKDGWTRTVRATDMKFQWTRFDERGNVDECTRFNADRSAYVLKIHYLDENDKLRRGVCQLVTPEQGVVDSKIKSTTGGDLVSYSDIATAQMKSYEDKIQWFQDTCAQLCEDWNRGHMRINVRREFLLGDSIEAIMSLSRKDLRKVWRFEFIGEAGIDAGGLAREWFELVTDEVFDPDMGLWQTSATNQMCLQINPASEISCPEDHLIYFRFLGRVMGKALFDRQLVKGHMVKHLYKHILGWPVMLNDLKDIDEEYYNSLKGLKDMGADVEYIYMDFTQTEENLGVKKTIDLIPDGASVDVTEENLPEYIEACLKYRLLGRYEAQLNELLLGFFDVIPEPLLTVFDFQELELLMCGLPEIDMDNWMEHTEYSGEYDREGPNHMVCIWFWEVVSEYDQELKARLLQFVTGTSGVPAKGFSSLQGNDGNVRKFTVHGVSLDTCVYPRSHTCFNRIDLPLYETREELEEKLKIAITMAATGFDIE